MCLRSRSRRAASTTAGGWNLGEEGEEVHRQDAKEMQLLPVRLHQSQDCSAECRDLCSITSGIVPGKAACTRAGCRDLAGIKTQRFAGLLAMCRSLAGLESLVTASLGVVVRHVRQRAAIISWKYCICASGSDPCPASGWPFACGRRDSLGFPQLVLRCVFLRVTFHIRAPGPWTEAFVFVEASG